MAYYLEEFDIRTLKTKGSLNFIEPLFHNFSAE